MKKYFIIIGILIVVLLITVGFFVKTVLFTEGRYYDDVDTEIKAEIDTENDIKDNYRYDYLIIEGKQYSLVQKDNYLLHASDYATVLEPFANFGDENQYTLYEVENDCDFKVYADSKNRALYCETEFVDDLINFYSDYNNFDFYCYLNNNDDEIKKTNIDSDKFSSLLKKYDDNPHITYVDYKKKDITFLTIVPVSKDKLYQEWQTDLYKIENNVYLHRSLGDIKLSDKDAKYFLQFFEQQKS